MIAASLEDLILNSSSLTDEERKRIEKYLLETKSESSETSALDEILQEQIKTIENLLDAKNLHDKLNKLDNKEKYEILWYLSMSEKYPNFQHYFLETLLRNQILNLFFERIEKKEEINTEVNKTFFISLADLWSRASSKIFEPEKKQKNSNLNIEWLKKNRNEYAGNYVALFEGELIAFGRTIKEADTKAKEKGYKKTLLHYLPGKDEEVWGGW